jgi:hypothetical protein
MRSRGAPISLFDAGQQRTVSLPPPAQVPVVVSAVPASAGAPTLGEARAAVIAETLCRVLTWKGYHVLRDEPAPRPADCPGGGRGCPPGAAGRVCVHVSGPQDSYGRQGLGCHLLVDVMRLSTFSKVCAHRDWHVEHRPPNLTDLAEHGVCLPDFEFGLLLAGHYRHPRGVLCSDLHHAISFEDASVARRRWGSILRRMEPLPQVRSYAEAAGLLSSDGRRVLDTFDAAISRDLNAPAALPVLYRAHRRGELPGDDRAVLATVAHALVPSLAAPPNVRSRAPGIGFTSPSGPDKTASP